MKRSTFLLITALLAGLFGCMMLLMPAQAAGNFGFSADPMSSLLIRSIGGMILSKGVLSFLVRNHGDSMTLRAVLLFNVLVHTLALIIDLSGVAQGVLSMDKIAVGIITHLFIGIGSLIYMMKISPEPKTA
jgi:hypothetical protein